MSTPELVGSTVVVLAVLAATATPDNVSPALVELLVNTLSRPSSFFNRPVIAGCALGLAKVCDASRDAFDIVLAHFLALPSAPAATVHEVGGLLLRVGWLVG